MDQQRLDAIRRRQANWIGAERGSIGKRVWGKTLIEDDIPALLAEIDRLTAEADTWRRRAECLESRLASMTAERDALIASLRNNDKCETCMHSLSDGCSAIRNGWRCRYVHPSEEWRGPEEEKHGTA